MPARAAGVILFASCPLESAPGITQRRFNQRWRKLLACRGRLCHLDRRRFGARGMGWVMAPTRPYRGHLYGNVILSRWPIVHHTQYDLTWKTCEARCRQRADIDTGEATLHMYNVHLGTALRERQYQAGRLAAFVHDPRVRGPKIVLGDFNEWTRGLATTILSRTLNSVDLRRFLRRRRTYPGVFPLLHFDHIYYEGSLDVEHVTLGRGRRAMVASDHLPLAADVRLTR